jgi:AraC-like DNA-binding protein
LAVKGFSNLDLPPSKAVLDTEVGYFIEAPHDIFNRDEFLKKNKCDMEKAGVTPNAQLPNEERVMEDVLATRNDQPRRLILMYKTTARLSESLVTHLIQDNQPRATFDFALAGQMAMRSTAIRVKRRHKLLTTAQVRKMAEKHLADLKKDGTTRCRDGGSFCHARRLGAPISSARCRQKSQQGCR